jgi:hypothetical protein
MLENNDKNAEVVAADEENDSGSSGPAPTPIFVSFVYDFVKMDPDLGGDGGGRPGTIGGPISKQDPKYKVYTYQYLPPVGENIEGPGE